MPFEPWHLGWLELRESQLALSYTLTREHGTALKAAGPCFTGFAGLDVIACAGVVEFWQGRAQVWSLLSWHMPRYAKSVHHAVKRFLADYHVRRLECVVDPRSKAAIRWALHLGFRCEGRMAAYLPDGGDQLMYVRLER